MMSKDDLIRQQASTIVQLQTETARLRKANQMLRQALQRDLEVQTVMFRDIAEKLERLEQPILATILSLSKRYHRPVTYNEIVRGFTAQHPFIKAKPPTIRRIVRKLREKGYLMKQGRDSFYPNLTPKLGAVQV